MQSMRIYQSTFFFVKLIRKPKTNALVVLSMSQIIYNIISNKPLPFFYYSMVFLSLLSKEAGTFTSSPHTGLFAVYGRYIIVIPTISLLAHHLSTSSSLIINTVIIYSLANMSFWIVHFYRLLLFFSGYYDNDIDDRHFIAWS